jgi:hypothetical protein
MKKVVFILFSMYISSTSLFSAELPFSREDVKKFKELGEFKISSLKDLKENNSKKHKDFNLNKKNDFMSLVDKKNNLKSRLDLADSLFTGSSFLTKEEAKIVSSNLRKGLKYSNQPKEFLIYLFSESVPKGSVLNFLLGVDILRENGFNISSKQYMVGYPKDFKQYMYDWRSEIEDYPSKYKQGVVDNFELKLDPRFFKMYEIKNVPAIALASCANIVPDPNNCKIKFLIHGDTPLTTFFDRISKEDRAYIEYAQVLNANKIYKPKNRTEVK